METSKTDIDTFLEISRHLTGFSEIELQGTGMLNTYYNVVVNMNSIDLVKSFLAVLKGILNDKTKIQKLIDANKAPDDKSYEYGMLAKKIITMWYTGEWSGEVISVESYKQGLIWGVAETHPPGAKQPGFASWSKPPIQVSKKAPDQEAPKASNLVNETDLVQIDK